MLILSKTRHLIITLLLFTALGLPMVGCGSGGDSNATTNTNVSLDANDGGFSNAATNISQSPVIVLLFSESMIPGTISNSNIQVSTVPNGTNPIPLGLFVANPNDTIFHFSPLNQLRPNTKYYISVHNTETASRSFANGTFYFTTGDLSSPTVSIINPQNNATNVSNTTTIQANFSESVTNVTRETVHLRDESGIDWPLFPITAVTGIANNYLITPKEPLDYATTYSVIFESQITDLNGNNLSQTTFQFTTAPAPIMYYTNQAMTNVQKCIIDRFGSPGQCTDSGAGGNIFSPIGGMAYNSSESMLYLLNQQYRVTTTTNFMQQCLVDANGDLSNCNNANNLAPYLNQPGFAQVVQNMLYIFYLPGATTNISQFTECKIINEQFFCLPVGTNNTNIFNGATPYSMVVNNNIAYLGLSNNTIAMCLINENDGSFASCSDSGATNVFNPSRIWLDDTNTHAYIYNFALGTHTPPSTVTVCSISSTNTLSNCQYISQTLLNGLGAYYEPLYFSKYLNRLVFFNTIYANQFTTIGILDNDDIVFSQESGDGTLNGVDITNQDGRILTTQVVY